MKKKIACVLLLSLLTVNIVSCSQPSQNNSRSNSNASTTQRTDRTSEDSKSTTNEYYDPDNFLIYKINVNEGDFSAAAKKAIGEEIDDKTSWNRDCFSSYLMAADSDVWFIYGKYHDQRDGRTAAEVAMDEFEACYSNFRSNIFSFVGVSKPYKNESESFGYLVMNGTIKTGSHLRFFQFDKKDDTTEDLNCYVFLYVNGDVFIEARTLTANDENIEKIDTFH